MNFINVNSRENAPDAARKRRLARRRPNWWRRLVLVVALAFFGNRFGWPRYLKWFHVRQEAAVFNEKLAGKMVRFSMPFSPRLHRKITVWVYLPPGYNKSSTRYPVVYVLHGMPGEVRDCFVKGQVQDAAEHLILTRKIPPLLLVSFDAHGKSSPADVTNFLNRADGSWQMEDFMTHELVPWLDHKFRTIPQAQARALDGVSAGGYAAFNLALKYPKIWSIGASHTGFFEPDDDSRNMTDILGTRGALWNANNPMSLMQRATPQQNLSFYLDDAQGDNELNEFKLMQMLLKRRHIDAESHVFSGRHSWEYWSEHYADSLNFIGQRFARNLNLTNFARPISIRPDFANARIVISHHENAPTSTP